MTSALTPPPELNITIPYRRGRRSSPCPCCGTKGGLCDSHKAFLAGVRAELESAAKANSLEGKRAKSPQHPICCSPGCFEPRTPPTVYCSDCLETAE